MQLTREQIDSFEEQGYLFFPNCFAEEEIALLRSEADKIFRTNRQEVWREKSGAPRTAFAAHSYNEAFRLMAHHPRLVEPLEQLFGEGVYVHQFKINAKAAFEGDVWQWHQDYGTWARDDGVLEPRAMNISIFLDEVLPINGPLMLIPKSHKYGTLAAGHDTSTTSYPLWTLDPEPGPRLQASAAVGGRGSRRPLSGAWSRHDIAALMAYAHISAGRRRSPPEGRRCIRSTPCSDRATATRCASRSPSLASLFVWSKSTSSKVRAARPSSWPRIRTAKCRCSKPRPAATSPN